MNSAQESKNELEAAIRYAENAISSAQATIESMQFRQDMAKKEYQERTGREAVLESELAGVRQLLDRMTLEHTEREQALEAEVAELNKQVEFYTKAYTELEVSQGRGVPTMPVIPRDVAIAIFREGIATGVLAACSELEGQSINIDESEYCGDFMVQFQREISLDEYVDFDWMRDKAGDYTEDAVIDSLKGLCADNKFECRIHGIDDQETNK